MFHQRKKDWGALESWCGYEIETYSNLHSCGILSIPLSWKNHEAQLTGILGTRELAWGAAYGSL
jgi:hypothetical protein